MGNEEILRSIGERISKRRRQLGITQEELAASMDVSPQMISYTEQGHKAIRPENLIKLCLALDVSADYILMGKVGLNEKREIYEKLELLSGKELEQVDSIIDSCLVLAGKKR